MIQSFPYTEMVFGAPNYISNLNIGDTIVISQGEYSAQGRVKSLEADTGLVSVGSWEDGSSVPPGGFTTSALLTKWQTEYIYTKTFLDVDGVVDSINMKYDVILGMKEVTLFSGFNAQDTMPFAQTGDRYMKYQFIYMTSKYGISSYLSTVNIDFENGGPTMDQVMRHGKWFNEGSEQTFWWSK